MTPNFDVPADWYETFFTGPANCFWEAMVPASATIAETAFIVRHIGAAPRVVVDAPCGAGRHALSLARAGYRVIGADISEEAIARANDAASAERLPAAFAVADMRRFASEPADALISMGNSISYFDDAGTRALFGNFARHVKPGGALILDTGCCAESVLPNFKTERVFEFEGGDYRSALFYDPKTSLLKTKATLRLGAERHDLRYAHRLVTTGALVGALDEAGFETADLYADPEDAPFAIGAPRLLLLARRR